MRIELITNPITIASSHHIPYPPIPYPNPMPQTINLVIHIPCFMSDASHGVTLHGCPCPLTPRSHPSHTSHTSQPTLTLDTIRATLPTDNLQETRDKRQVTSDK